jgi:SEL1 protein
MIHVLTISPEPKKDRSFSEWIANFLQTEGQVFDDEEYYNGGDLYDGALGDGQNSDDDGVVESILIIGITFSLVFLLWWRQRLQQAHQQAEDAPRREQGLPPNPRAEAPGADFGWGAAGGVVL